MEGLATYYDSDHEDGDDIVSPSKKLNDTVLKSSVGASSDSRKNGKAPVKIKRPAHPLRHPRTHSPEVQQPVTASNHVHRERAVSPEDLQTKSLNTQDELSQIRALLVPPSIPGVSNWGIPPPPNSLPGVELQAKLSQFHRLKHNPDRPRHFNDELMANRTFRNPHLYTKLVEHIDVDEATTNFPPDVWNPHDVQPEWFADRIADRQKIIYEQQAQAQAPSKRNRIDFASSSSKQGQDPPAAAAPRSGLSYGGRNDGGREYKKGRWR